MAQGKWDKLRLAELLRPHVDPAKLSEAIDAEIRRLQLPVLFSKNDALAILAGLADSPGVLGVAARFARARVLLSAD